MIKLNIDAACLNEKTIAVVGGDGNWNILKVWAWSIMSCSHSFAETSAIIWALQLAKDKKFWSIIVKSDSKLYGDAINKNLEACLEI